MVIIYWKYEINKLLQLSGNRECLLCGKKTIINFRNSPSNMTRPASERHGGKNPS